MTDPAQRRKPSFVDPGVYRLWEGLLRISISHYEREQAPRRPRLIVGDLMKELAAICHIYDMDIMHAGHNTLDKLIYENGLFQPRKWTGDLSRRWARSSAVQQGPSTSPKAHR